METTAKDVDVAVIGAGQAGLSSGYFLRRFGFHPLDGGDSDSQDGDSQDSVGDGADSFVILDGNDGPGGAWRHRWPSLTFGTTHHVHDLPGFPIEAVDDTRPAAEVVADYYDAYEREFDLRVRRPVAVDSVWSPNESPNNPANDSSDKMPDDGRLTIETHSDNGIERWAARALINATGTWTRPFWPWYPGRAEFRGRQLHTVDYRSAAEFRGQRVLVVGGGTSALELLAEISEVADTTWVTRRTPVFRSEPFTEDVGREAVAAVERRVRAGLPPASVVSVTGLSLAPRMARAAERGVYERLPMFERITPTGVVWADGTEMAVDVILWCTGFRPAIDHLAPLRLRGPAGGIRMIDTRAAADERVHLVGYGPSASTIGASRAGRNAARAIRRQLDASDAINTTKARRARDSAEAAVPADGLVAVS